MQTEKIIHHIVNWLSDYLENSHQKGFVIGISGGIDSAVTSTLCAMTGYPVLCMDMSIHQASSEVNRALSHIEWLQVKFPKVSHESVDLTSVYDQFKSQVKPSSNPEAYDLSLANTRSRLRMTTLYYYAGINSFIVAGTGNKVEDFGVGFFTKYGDGGVDVSPIGDLMKSEVYAIAKHLGIVESIQKAAPTDGLFGDARTDEMQIGASYDELEWAMRTAETDFDRESFSDRQKEVMEIYQKRHRANLHKMEPIPVCEIPKAFFLD